VTVIIRTKIPTQGGKKEIVKGENQTSALRFNHWLALMLWRETYRYNNETLFFVGRTEWYRTQAGRIARTNLFFALRSPFKQSIVLPPFRTFYIYKM